MASPRHVPFRDVELTLEEEQQCHDRAFQLLDRTLRSYDERDGQGEGRPTTPRHHSDLDNTQWKLLKTQDDASMYIERNNKAQLDLNLLGGGWENPVVLLTAGTIRGDLDEIMLGMETPDFASLKTRSEIFTNQAVDGAVLSKLASSTEDDPFRYMAVHWQMFEHHWPLNKMVNPRDFVSIASIGTMTRTNGERIGYEVVLPASLSRYPALPKPFVRGQIMYTVIFKQLEPGIVDVYLHTYVETLNFILDKLVVTGIWKATLGMWRSPQLAELKKLQWAMHYYSLQRQQQQQQASPSKARVCKKCLEKRTARSSQGHRASFNEKNSCVLCLSPTCSDCLVERTFKVPDKRKIKLKDQRVCICRPCLAFAQQLRPVDIAGQNRASWQSASKQSSSTHSSEVSMSGDY